MASKKRTSEKRKRSTLSPHPHRGPLKQIKAEKTLDILNPKPFLETALGRLPLEIRAEIFVHLLASPPPFGGRDLRVEQNLMDDRQPMSLTNFIDIKKSCLTVLQTYHQIYLEAFPTFYANKSYYLANAQDLVTFDQFGGYRQVGPRLFQFDKITSLCLKDLVINEPRWNSQQIDDLVSSRFLGLDREVLEAQRTNRITFDLIITDFRKMKSLRKICLCIQVGQEWEYLEFLFKIRGLGRGVIDFVDNFHWIIRSQSVLGKVWNTQYAAFASSHYLRGRNFELLEYEDVSLLGEVLNIDSRASDLTEGDERWIEVDIGSRNYEEELLEAQYLAEVAPGQGLGSQQELPDGETDDLLTYDESYDSSERIQERLDAIENGLETKIEPDQGFVDSQQQSYQGPPGLLRPPKHDEDGDLAYNEQDQDPLDLQEQPNGEAIRAKVHEQDHESAHPRDQADAEDGDNSGTNTDQEPGPLEGASNEDCIGTSAHIVPEEESLFLQGLNDIENHHVPTAIGSNQGLKGFTELADESVACVQMQRELSLSSPISLGGADGSLDGVDVQFFKGQPGSGSQASTALSSRVHRQFHCDAQTRTVLEDSGAETATAPARHLKSVQWKTQVVNSPTRAISTSTQMAGSQSSSWIEQKMPAQPKPQSSEKSQQDMFIAAKSLQEAGGFLTLQNSIQPPGNPRSQQGSTSSSTYAEKRSDPEAKRQVWPTSGTRRDLHRCFRAAAFILALALLYMILYAKVEKTRDQLLALLLFVVLFFVSLWSDSE